MKHTKWIAGLLAAALLTSSLPAAFAADTKPAGATRAEVCEMLLGAADAYHVGVQKSDILRGDTDGQLHEERGVTRAEALVMLQRAFGALPKPVGDNARCAYPAASFTDVPAWAKSELQSVLDAGIVAGTSATTFSPNEAVTRQQMELFIRRTYALLGANEKDDLSATVNKAFLDKSVIKPGSQASGTLYDLAEKSSADVTVLIKSITAATKPYAHGTKEQKISDLYSNVLNWDARNKAGIAPIQPYLDAITKAQSLSDLMAVQQKTSDELGVQLYLGFSLAPDAKDSTKYMLYFGGISPMMSREVYTEDGAQRTAYLNYLKQLYTLGGMSADEAARQTTLFFEMEAALSKAQMEPQEYGDIDKIYNVYTMAQLKKLFPKVDIDAVLAQTGLKATDTILVMDPGLLAANAAVMDEAHLPTLKAAGYLGLLASYGETLSRAFIDANDTFKQAFLGVQGKQTDEEAAADVLQSWMPEYLGKLYVEQHFSAQAKNDVTAMVKEFLAIYKERIGKLDWMSEQTKAKAIRKLDTMKIKIGYPDNWESAMDDVDIKSVADGGSFFANAVAVGVANRDDIAALQGEEVDKTEWGMPAYMVNAQYNAMSNDITFPAGILQAPLYDVNASREKNLGGIGYVIAHEITHAFDNNGAKFDENGNANNWWTAADTAAFRKLCDEVVTYYDGQEAAPGITCNGTLTLSENIADLGAAACITQAAKKLPKPDFKQLYTAMTQTWASTMSRESSLYASQLDVHAPNKLRGNRVVQSCDEFYTAFDIQPGDGMYLEPAQRVSIW